MKGVNRVPRKKRAKKSLLKSISLAFFIKTSCVIEANDTNNRLSFPTHSKNLSTLSHISLHNQNSALHLLNQLHYDDISDCIGTSHSTREGAADILSPTKLLLDENTINIDIDSTNENNLLEKDDFSYYDLQLSIDSKLPSMKTPQGTSGVYLPNFQEKSSSLRFLKTGTTIVGCLADRKKAVVLAADTRATSDTIVADKVCEKIHCLAPNVWCCGAGTSGDIDALMRQVKYTFLLRNRIDDAIGNNIDEHENNENENEYIEGNFISFRSSNSNIGNYINKADITNVGAMCKFIRSQLFKTKGEIGANLVIGGYEYTTNKAVLVAIHPHGSMDASIPFTALGSGGLAAMSTLEANYDPSITLEEAKLLAIKAVKAGIDNDLGSGSQVDICVITEEGIHYERAVMKEEELILTDRDRNTNDAFFTEHSTSTHKDDNIIMNGVNGFGSLPYSIRSKKVIVENEELTEQKRRDWIQKVLDI